MKFALQVGFIVVVFVAIPPAKAEMSVDELKGFSTIARKACTAKIDVDTALLDQLQKGIFVEDNENLKCYVKCVHVKLQLVKKGRYDTDRAIAGMKKVTPKEMIPNLQAAFEKCRGCAADVTDLCEVSWICTKCFQQHTPDEFFFP